MKIEKTGYNYRTRKARTICAFIYDADGATIDVIFPGEGNHTKTLDWAEWRAGRIPADYPEAAKMVVFCGDDEIAVITFEAEPTHEATADEIAAAIEATAPRSAWAKGVKNYALDLLDWYTSEAPEKPLTLETVLNGAEDWGRYSWGAFGVGLVGNCLIAEALCTATELKITKGGTRRPNSREEWPDVQARALSQAWEMITRTAATLNTAAR